MRAASALPTKRHVAQRRFSATTAWCRPTAEAYQ